MGILHLHFLAAGAEHGLSRQPLEVFRVFGLPISNSMVVAWTVAIGLIVFVQLATRRMMLVPDSTPQGRAQNLIEWLVEKLYGFLEGIIGRKLVDRTFWFFASIFIFI